MKPSMTNLDTRGNEQRGSVRPLGNNYERMNLLVSSIFDDLEYELSTLEGAPHLSRSAQGKELALEAIHHLYTVVFDSGDPGEYTLIRYNKEWLPPLLAKAIFFEWCYRLEFQKQNRHPGHLASFINSDFAEMDMFFGNHEEFCRYHDRQGESRDRLLFADRQAFAPATDLEKFGLSRYINASSFVIGKILAYKEYSAVLRDELTKLGPVNFSMDSVPDPEEKRITYKGTKMGLVELTTALYAKGEIHLDGKPATKEFIVRRFEKALNVDLKDHKVMRSRISDETPFLRDLSTKLEEYIDQSLNGEHPDKKLKRQRRTFDNQKKS